MSNRKWFRRKKKAQIEDASPEVIHIENNLVISWLLHARNYFKGKKSQLKKIFVIIFVVMIPIIIGLFLYASLTKKQNYLFFGYLKEFKEVKALNSGDEKTKKLESLNKNSYKLCHTFFKTSHSYSGCLVEAATWIELGFPEKASEPLDLFGQKNSHNGIGLYSLFFAAQTYENLFEFDKAYQIYHQLEEPFKEIKKDDIPLFNKGKILFLQGKKKLAEEMFLDLLERFPESKLVEGTRSFLKLIAFRKSEELLATPPIKKTDSVPVDKLNSVAEPDSNSKNPAGK